MPTRAQRKVLVIEDDTAIRETLGQLLEIEGYPAAFAANGREGLTQLKTHGEDVGLILLDLMMPVMDGREFLETLRRDGSSKENAIPVYICSAIKDIGVSQVAGVLRKPIELSLLLETLKRHCG